MAARVGNRILSIMAGILILLMLSYGVYSLWDTYKIYANSFADEELLKFRPTDDGEDNPTLKDLKKLNPDVKAWIQDPASVCACLQTYNKSAHPHQQPVRAIPTDTFFHPRAS